MRWDGRRLARRGAAMAAIASLASCMHVASPVDTTRRAHLRGNSAFASADPTVLGARVVPESIVDERTFGLEPGGGVRAITTGVRVIGLPGGAMVAADERLPQTPSFTTPLPERLGGGFLFVLGPTLWRAERWLAPVRPIFTSPSVISRIFVGLDRVYLRAPNGSHQAIDPRTGARLDLGPWPGSSFVGAYAALDGWRAVAVNDLRGVVATFDAGATWKPLGLPIDPKDVLIAGDLLLVTGLDAARGTAWYEVRADGQVGRTTADAAIASVAADRPPLIAIDGLHTFGNRPLATVIEDGFPLSDGTAVVARDGALGRVRLVDGALLEVARDAFPLKPSRCHAVPLARPSGVARNHGSSTEFGFVCGEPRGTTILYAYDPATGTVVEDRRFDSPRAVLAAGTGAVAVRGGCAEGASEEVQEGQRSYCIRGTNGAWREVRVRGANGSERVVALADGSVAVLSPPEGNLAAARVTVLQRGQARTVPMVFSGVDHDVLRIVRTGAWLDGFEERRPGALGGWIETGGTFLGVQVEVDGTVTVGKFIRELGTPMVSGRYGLGWSPSRRGFETTDGGMTWTSVDVPEPVVPTRLIASRACGPIGCTAAGWLRVGWGEAKRPPLPDPPPSQRSQAPGSGPVELDCAPISLSAAVAPSGSPIAPRKSRPSPPPLPPSPVARSGLGVLGGLSSPARPVEVPPFYAIPPPSLRADETELSIDALDVVARAARSGPLSRLYAWGPKNGDWDKVSHWVARWVWPYGDSSEVRTTAPSTTPFSTIEAARRVLGQGSTATSFVTASSFWTFAVGDDPHHALFLGRRNSPLESTVLVLEEGHPIVEARRADREPFGEIEAATRAGRRWYVATAQSPGELPATVVWQIDGTTAYELRRVPRAGFDARPFGTYLASRADGRAVGLVVDGQPAADRYLSARWMLPIDTETGKVGDPEPLGTIDFTDHPPTTLCRGDDTGWLVDVPWSGAPVRLHVFDEPLGAVQSLMARMRVRRDRACIESLSGSLDYAQLSRAEAYRGRARDVGRSLQAHRDDDTSPAATVSVFAGGARHALSCVSRPSSPSPK